MKIKNPTGGFAQIMHAVFDGAKQLTAWRPCRVATMGALHRSGHRAYRLPPLPRKPWEKPVPLRSGPVKVRERDYAGLTVQSKVFVTPARVSAVAA